MMMMWRRGGEKCKISENPSILFALTSYDPDPNPKKLEKEERETLSRQRRCWACRGSGHRGNDSICPQFKEKKLNTTRIVEIDSDSESGKA